MSWGPIQLRLKGSRQVEFDGEASPAPGGGSMPIRIERISIAWNTPDLVLTGIPIYVPAPGEFLLAYQSFVSVTTAWDDHAVGGNVAQLHIRPQGSTGEDLFSGPFTLATANQQGDGGHMSFLGSLTVTNSGALGFNDTTPLEAMVDDNGGQGDPLSTQGEGEIVLVIAAAP